MNLWEWLDISPTSDLREIKSAYARAAKRYHPEEHPEEFKELQKAYKKALLYAKLQSGAVETGQKSQSAGISEQPTEPAVQAAQDRPDESTGNEKPETVFDFSRIDSYGDKEQFFRSFYLLVYNPYLINNRLAWNSFLCQPSSVLLFQDPFFRREFVLAVCGVYGLKRDTVLYFEQYLLQFHRPEFAPPDGIWETSFPCFLKLKHRRLSPSLLGSKEFRGKEGRAFQNQVMSALSRRRGQISWDRQQDVEAYMQIYLSFANDNEEKLARLYRKRKCFLWDRAGLPAVILIFFILTIIVNSDQGKDGQENYLKAIQIQQESVEKSEWIWNKAQSDIDRVIRDWQKWEMGLDETHSGNTDTERHWRENGGAFFPTGN